MAEVIRALDLYSGLDGASQAFRDRGHEVLSVDVNPALEPDLVADVRDRALWDLLAELGPWDFIWASPPCPTFSKLAIRWYWNQDGTPSHPLTWERIALVYDTFALIEHLAPRAFIVENPAGKMRHLQYLSAFDRRSVTYCQYGHFLRKETDLWGGFPPTLDLEPVCGYGDPCHDASPRNDQGWGADTIRDGWDQEAAWDSDQWGAAERRLREAWERDSRNQLPHAPDRKALRSLVPYQLSEAVCEAMESWGGGTTWRDHQATNAQLTDYLGADA